MAEQPEKEAVQDNSEVLAAIAALEMLYGKQVQELNGRIDEIQTNAANSEKAPIVARLVANTACPLEEDSLKGMAVSDLLKLETSYTPADYSGNSGSFYAHVDANEGEYKTEVVK